MSASSAPRRPRSDIRLSLIFAPGQRPSADDVRRWAEIRPGRAPGFAIHEVEPSSGNLELLVSGMAFNVVGLAPASPAPLPEVAHYYGFTQKPVFTAGEAITLTPGEQLRGMEHLLPVVRALAGVAARLVALSDVMAPDLMAPNPIAVAWHPARCAMAPTAFAIVTGNWLNGGAFPALGLTALFRDSAGAMCSEGLAFFIGRELRIEPDIGISTSVNAKIATRLINHLVGCGPIHQPFEFLGPNDEHLSVEPVGDDGFLRVWRSS